MSCFALSAPSSSQTESGRAGDASAWSGRAQPPPNWTLERGAVRSFDLASGEEVTVQIRSGACWLTMENDSTDYALAGGEAQTFHGPGRLVAEALGAPATLQVGR